MAKIISEEALKVITIMMWVEGVDVKTLTELALLRGVGLENALLKNSAIQRTK